MIKGYDRTEKKFPHTEGLFTFSWEKYLTVGMLCCQLYYGQFAR